MLWYYFMRRILNHIRACVARRQQSRCERARVLQLPAVGAVVWRLVYIYVARAHCVHVT
jgi:hypothetical protein